MRTMLIVMFLLYGGMQLYDVTRVAAGLALAWPGTAVLVAWAALMTVMPMLIWRWERRGWHRRVAAGAWIGYGWMGVSFLFFWISLAVGLVGALLPLASADSGLSARADFLWTCALIAAVAVYGFVDARHPRIERVTLRTPKLAARERPRRLREDTSIHWHGILLPYPMDGVPGIGFNGTPPGEIFTYRFKVQQSGTYWYHSHSGMQEQTGMFGAIVIEPAQGAPIRADREHVVMLSDWTDEDPMQVLSKLEVQSDCYNFNRPTVCDIPTSA